MHRVVKSHLNAFCSEFSISFDEPKAFEAFSAYAIAKQFTFENINPELLVYEGKDPGIDSAFFIVNEDLVTSISEIETVFAKKKTDNDIKLILVQAKTSESWQKSHVDSFAAAALDFVSDDPQHGLADELRECRDIFQRVIGSLGKVKSGRPDILCYIATTAGRLDAIEIKSAISAFSSRLEETGLFTSAEVLPVGRDALVSLWGKSRGSYEAQIEILGSASFPKSEGIEESYVVTVSAKSFVDRILTDDRGGLRRSIFDENVRDFIDFDDSAINKEIRLSLTSAASSARFGILNNGVTIISPDVRVQSNEIYITNYQIVNGCQTSNVLYETRDQIPSNATLMVKIIETSNQTIVDDIVKSTNRQNKIEDHQFLATMDSIKTIERYFNARTDDEERRLYFERRPHQFGKDNIPSIRTFDIKEIARCTGAMFFDKPDLSSRYPSQLVEDLRPLVFDPQNREEIFYTAAFANYRLTLHLSNKRIDPIFNQLRWYALMAVKYFICGKQIAAPSSAKIEQQCTKILDFVSQNDPHAMQRWDEIADLLKSLGHVDRDRLRATRFVQEVRDTFTS
jgi:AIPR protein